MLHALRQRIRELTNDCEAQRRTIHALTAEIDLLKLDAQAQALANRRTTDERDYWRHVYNDLSTRLAAVTESLTSGMESRHD